VSELWDEGDEDPSPICPFCGVSALPAETPGQEPICENAACATFGEPIADSFS